jgi:hypothetical protein
LLALFYPITLTKTALFTPLWLATVAVLSRFVEARAVTILTLLIPQVAGIVLLLLFGEQARSYFGVVNFRMLAVPSNALNVYGDFFSSHEPTHFCQITFLKKIMSCPYDEPLYVIMQKTYGLGFFNASLFATEGVASVGQKLAPVAVFFCSLVIVLGSSAARHLPPRFILISGAVLALHFLDIPLSILMLTHGAGLMFLLWYLTPLSVLGPFSGQSPAASGAEAADEAA